MNGFLILVLMTLHVFIAAQTDQYRAYARAWSQEYIYNDRMLIEQGDLQAIKRLIELSRDRAAYTLEVQEHAWQVLNLYWKGWQNFAQTRLNPSKERPYHISSDEQQATQDFWQMLEMHEELCKAYSEHTAAVVHGNALKRLLAKDAVDQMRTQARVCMLDALTDVKTQLEGLYDITFKQLMDLVDDAVEQENQMRGFNIGTFLMHYIPNLMVHKFIEADAFYAILSEEGWSILDKVQLIGNQAWHAIETARVSFYQALLEELDTVERFALKE